MLRKVRIVWAEIPGDAEIRHQWHASGLCALSAPLPLERIPSPSSDVPSISVHARRRRPAVSRLVYAFE
ncbi:hypothetical protein K523DRAFT_422502 [Schizophyllum commune Tattone D]|nr:hypothetical protein K523DRAFT_422502 [Schizophyllum commune Tattone D]